MADFTDEALVYVDPKARKVIGPVIWLPNGKVKAMEMVIEEVKPEETDESKEKKPIRRPRKPKKRYYPWCSYRTAKKLYHVEGKYKEEEKNQPLDEVLKRAMKEPFWD